MAERGAVPKVPKARQRALHAVRSLFSPLLPDDYLELINPLWSTQELRGRIERIERETADAVTVLIRPGYEWQGHQPGQYLRIGVVVDGVHHWRAYSLTSEPGAARRAASASPRSWSTRARSRPTWSAAPGPGTSSASAASKGPSCSPTRRRSKLLFISAGSGITPIMSMLRSLAPRATLWPTSSTSTRPATADGVIFAEPAAATRRRARAGYRLHLRMTGGAGRMAPADLDRLCPDWRERHAFVSGPARCSTR